jgi:hypothetical protein
MMSGTGQNADYGVMEAVLYVARMLRCFRVAKLVATIFLAQYEVERRVVYEYRCGGRPLARAEFYIWTHELMSNEIHEVLESGDFDVVQGELGLETCYAGPAPQLPQPVATRLSDAAAKYGGWKPWQLRLHVNKLLGLDIPEKRSDYMGVKLNTYLRAEGYSIEAREVC